jgi:hypothetical protein
MRRPRLTGATLLGASLCLALLSAPPALADHHEMKIREVSPGSSSLPNLEYVELQMYSAGQNFLAGNGVTVTLYGSTGIVTETTALATNVPNGQSQRRVLVGTVNLEDMFGTAADPDFEFPAQDNLDPNGGAACFNSAAFFGALDCVSWGNFSGTPPDETGGNVSPGGIADAMALRRSIARGCPSLLEATDDRNRPADWAEVSPDPLNNSAPAGGPACPNTKITKGPEGKTEDRRPTFRFKSIPPGGATFECKLDDKPFKGCDSPHTTRKLSFGRHKFRVKASRNGAEDPTPDVARFKVVRRG